MVGAVAGVVAGFVSLGVELWHRVAAGSDEHSTSHRNIATMWPQLSSGKVLSFVLRDLITRNYRMPQGDPFTLEGLNTTAPQAMARQQVKFPSPLPRGGNLVINTVRHFAEFYAN